MKSLALIRSVCLLVVGFVTLAPTSSAMVDDPPQCSWCTIGVAVCPEEEDLAATCAANQCPKTRPGCAENFGSCTPGYRLVCNPDM